MSNLKFVMPDGDQRLFNFENRLRPKLSILIPTTYGRESEYAALHFFLNNIIDLHDLHEHVQITSMLDNKEMSVGEKRQRLYDGSLGMYSWQIDDDDSIHADAIPLILEAMASDPDCITFEEHCTIDGVEKRSNFSLQYADWGDNIDGYDYVRTPFFKTPIKTSICRQVAVPPIRFGEDHAWAQAIKPLLKTEVHIDRPLYFYQHISSPHNDRYGIK